MMKYEQDFIYQIIPNLTHAIKDMTKELKRYNDNFERKNFVNEAEVIDLLREENDDK